MPPLYPSIGTITISPSIVFIFSLKCTIRPSAAVALALALAAAAQV